MNIRKSLNRALTGMTMLSGLGYGPAQAQTPPAGPPPAMPVKSVPLALASEMALTATETCVARGYKVSTTVVDSAGGVIIALRADAANARLLEFSKRKAFTSATTKRKTSELLEISKQNPTAPEIPVGDNFILLSGGMPIFVNGELIGAIGVGGAPAGPTDEQCAEAGLAKVSDRLK